MTGGGWRVVYADERYVIRAEGCDPRSSPAPVYDGGLPALLNRLAPHMDRQAVVMLDGDLAVKLGLDEPDTLIAELARAGWQCNRVSDWTTVYGKGRPKLHIAHQGQLSAHTFPLWAMLPHDMVARLALWHELLGSPYHGSPAMAGMTVCAELDRARVARSKAAGGDAHPPTWRPKDGQDDGPDDGMEDCYRTCDKSCVRRGCPRHWCAPLASSAGGMYAHAYDKIRAYIAAGIVAEVSPRLLVNTGRIPFDARRAGWWQVEVAPWVDSRMPDPAGYLPVDEQPTIRKITTPRLALLEQLTAEGVYGGVRIIDSWTGPARDYPIKPLCERLRDAYALKFPHGTPRGILDQDVDPFRGALKVVGHKALGATDDATNWFYRSHIWHTLVAVDAANQWRLMWGIGNATDRWPMRVEADQIWYTSDHEDPAAAAPTYVKQGRTRGILLDPTGVQLGRYRTKTKPRRLRKAA